MYPVHSICTYLEMEGRQWPVACSIQSTLLRNPSIVSRYMRLHTPGVDILVYKLMMPWSRAADFLRHTERSYGLVSPRMLTSSASRTVRMYMWHVKSGEYVYCMCIEQYQEYHLDV